MNSKIIVRKSSLMSRLFCCGFSYEYSDNYLSTNLKEGVIYTSLNCVNIEIITNKGKRGMDCCECTCSNKRTT